MLSSNINVSFCLVADEAFPLNQIYKHLHFSKRTLNYKLSKARRKVEHAFGILVNKFHISQKPTAADLAEGPIRSVGILYNLIKNEQTEIHRIMKKNY
jgi:hypothetical protein